MGRYLLWVGVGGFLGSVGRYLTTEFFGKLWPSQFPYGTFAVNIIGCLAIGVIYGLSQRMGWLNLEWKLLLATGFCGGYTTFSSFAFENTKLLQSGNYVTFFSYTLLSLVVGVVAVFVGLLIAKI